MRTREKSYSDYGISTEEKEYILDFCRTATEANKAIIKSALSELSPYVAPYIYVSLTEGMSYDKMIVKQEIYMSKEDFYGYRRKGIEAIKRHMLLLGVWDK